MVYSCKKLNKIVVKMVVKQGISDDGGEKSLHLHHFVTHCAADTCRASVCGFLLRFC